VSDYSFKFPELYQFFGGYFYQGWASDYRWDGAPPHFAAVVRHYKAVNPPATLNKVRNELEDLLTNDFEDAELYEILNKLGNNFYPPSEKLSCRAWLEKILEVLGESPTTSRVLRELR
jgi:hypothetical protein